jgi:hypothetical protein
MGISRLSVPIHRPKSGRLQGVGRQRELLHTYQDRPESRIHVWILDSRWGLSPKDLKNPEQFAANGVTPVVAYHLLVGRCVNLRFVVSQNET